MKYIIDYIIVFFTFIGNTLSKIGNIILQLFIVIGKVVELLFACANALPTVIKVTMIGIIVACVVYKILGREGGEAD